ncbi:MAG: peptidylprolyl isomerase [Ginsengibacter sp.]
MVAKKGDTVKVHYTGKLTTGDQFDSSEGRDPLEFTVGAGQMIPGFDKAIPGMVIGDKKTVTLAPEEAYGPKNEAAIIEFPKENIPAEMKLEQGMKLQLRDEKGHPIPVVVTDIHDTMVVLDANHELAGKELIFDIELVEIAK